MVERTEEYGVLVGKLKERNNLEKPRCRWEEKIEIYLEEIGRKGADWIDLKKTALFWTIAQQVVVM